MTTRPSEGAQPLNHLLAQFTYLQVLDLLTTVAFLLHGVEEGNPVVRFVLGATDSPIGGLLLVKVVAVLLGIACWRLGRARVLYRINLLFALVVTWNLVAIIAQSLR
jgi:hypothetical protein